MGLEAGRLAASRMSERCNGEASRAESRQREDMTMATSDEPAKGDDRARPVEAPVLGTTRLPPSAREALVHPDPAPLHAVPQDAGAEATLARVESLLGRGQFGAALREAGALRLD